MAELIVGSICLTDLGEKMRNGHSAFSKGKNGKDYANVNIWINEDKDKYGNNVSIQLGSSKEARDKEEKAYIGNGRMLDKIKQQPQSAPAQAEDDGMPF